MKWFDISIVFILRTSILPTTLKLQVQRRFCTHCRYCFDWIVSMLHNSEHIVVRYILLLNLFIGFSFGQVKIRHVVKDKLGNRNKITHYLKTHDGISITQIVNYYDDGRRYRVYTYENGMKHGKYIKWTRTAEKDNQEMVKQAYYLSEKGNYKHGKRSGGMKTFYRNGQLRWKGIYRRGIIAGPVNEFYPNGQLHRIILYMDGEKDGEYISYYEDGQLELEGEYFRGIRIGTWKFYGRNQEVVEEIIYKEGQPWEGTYTAWDSQKTPAPCTGDPMIFGFLYKNGNQSLIYRDENKKIFICTDDNTIHNIEQNI